MATETLYRKANVSRAEAITALFARFPNADLVSFEPEVKNGVQMYAATIRVAEFPPSDEGGSDDSEEKSESKPPKSEDSDKGDDDKSDTSDSDTSDTDSGDSKPPFGGGDDAGVPGEPKKLSPEEESVHLLHQIVDLLKQQVGGPAAGGPGDLDLPDVGAPAPGDTFPPKGGPAGGAPLPPPVKDKAPVGVGAFSHVADLAEIDTVREDAKEVANKTIIAEAAQVFPKHRVARIQRTGFATINGDRIDLAEAGYAVVKLVRK